MNPLAFITDPLVGLFNNIFSSGNIPAAPIVSQNVFNSKVSGTTYTGPYYPASTIPAPSNTPNSFGDLVNLAVKTYGDIVRIGGSSAPSNTPAPTNIQVSPATTQPMAAASDALSGFLNLLGIKSQPQAVQAAPQPQKDYTLIILIVSGVVVLLAFLKAK